MEEDHNQTLLDLNELKKKILTINDVYDFCLLEGKDYI